MSKIKKFNMDEAYQRLQTIVAEFEAGDLSLEESIPKFKEGLQLAKQLKTNLADFENQINTIKAEYMGEEVKGK